MQQYSPKLFEVQTSLFKFSLYNPIKMTKYKSIKHSITESLSQLIKNKWKTFIFSKHIKRYKNTFKNSLESCVTKC